MYEYASCFINVSCVHLIFVQTYVCMYVRMFECKYVAEVALRAYKYVKFVI
jgi:hypothetical protein